MDSENAYIEGSYRTMIMIWFGLLASQFMFLIVTFFAKSELLKFDFSRPFLNSENSMIVIILAVAGIATFLMSFVMRSKFLKQAVDNQNIRLIQTAMIIGCALCEATTLFGVILAFIFTYQYFFLWITLGILGIIMHFPKRENLVAASYKKL